MTFTTATQHASPRAVAYASYAALKRDMPDQADRSAFWDEIEKLKQMEARE